MKTRGNVLRDTSMGPGLLMADGKQYSFALEDMWQSELAPRIGMAVEVTLSLFAKGARSPPSRRRAITSGALRRVHAGGIGRARRRLDRAEYDRGADWPRPRGWPVIFSATGSAQFANGRAIRLRRGACRDRSVWRVRYACLAGAFGAAVLARRRAHVGALLPLAFSAFGGTAAEVASAMRLQIARRAMRAVSRGASFYWPLAASVVLAAKGTIWFHLYAK